MNKHIYLLVSSIVVLITFLIVFIVFASDSTTVKIKVNYNVENINFKSGKLQLEGTLFIPYSKDKLAAFVIVNGSGPIDRDGRVITNPNKQNLFYKQWAEYLSSHGVATLRYDKRYITHKTLNPLEVSQEDQIDDILSATRYLQNREEIDPKRIFILGYSEGGSIVPVAAQRLPNITGIVLMAASSIPIDQLFLAQLRKQHSPYVEATNKAFIMLKEDRFPRGGQIWGGGEDYWREWIDYTVNAEKIVLSLNKSILVLQGLADENYPGNTLKQNISNWENTANKSEKISFKIYENTTHLFLLKNSNAINKSTFLDILDWVNNL